MKKVSVFILVFCFIFAGCSSGKGDEKIVAQVNRYRMSVEDLRYELKNAPYDDLELMDTSAKRKEYLDRFIEKEILIQEAQRQGLDREKDFMRSIENYWEQVLLKLLLQRKSKEISNLVHVYDNEIKDYYADSREALPFSRVKREIERAVRQQKQTEAMDAWIEELRKKSYIEINEKLLEETFFNR